MDAARQNETNQAFKGFDFLSCEKGKVLIVTCHTHHIFSQSTLPASNPAVDFCQDFSYGAQAPLRAAAWLCANRQLGPNPRALLQSP